MNKAIPLAAAADLLGVHYMTAYRYVRLGILPAAQRDGRWMVSPDDVATLAATRKAPPGRPGGNDEPPGVDAPTVRRLVERMLNGDESGSWSIVANLREHGRSSDAIALELIGPAMTQIGDDWAAGAVSIAGEHIATGVAMRIWARLAAGPRPVGRHWGVAVVAAPTGEQHALPLAVLADLLRWRGLRVVDIGVDCPPGEIAAIAAGQDRLVGVGLCLTATLTDEMERHVRETCGLLRRETSAEILLGGAAIADQTAAVKLGAHAWSPDAMTALRWFESKRAVDERQAKAAGS